MDKLLPTAASLRNMISEMNRKNLDLKRITKTASLLVLSGLSENSIPQDIIERCLDEQQSDGGWVAVVDTMWNTFFLKRLDPVLYKDAIEKAFDFLLSQVNANRLWGRSQRDISRIPVTGIMFYLLPQLANPERLRLLEELWQSEKNSITYKSAYTLMAFRAANYSPLHKDSINETLDWLIENQEDDGGFAPWKSHPAPSDVFCTSIAVSGLLQYKQTVPPLVFQKAFQWLLATRLPNGIWPYHEIEDGGSWGLFALTQLMKAGLDGHG